MTRELSGVWLSTEPLDANEGAFGDVLFTVDLEADLSQFEIIEEGKPYREFLVPAALLNAQSRLTVEDIDAEEVLSRAHKVLTAPAGSR